MILTPLQQKALDEIDSLVSDFPQGGRIGVIGGVAGTGKSTLIRFLVEEYEGVLVVTPTGKAAVRAREVSGALTKTIHSWLYRVEENPKNGVLNWILKSPHEVSPRPSCGFVIVDEASMVTFSVFRDLFSVCKKLGLHIILVGDFFQLPPVETDQKFAGFSVFNDELPAAFRVTLTEIHRQALDSPIIRATMALRTGQFPADGLSELPFILERDVPTYGAEAASSSGVIICHKNITRSNINRAVRGKLGKSPDNIEKGEPLLVMANNYVVEVYNGETVDILSVPAPINTEPTPVFDAESNSSTYVNFLGCTVNTPMLGKQPVCIADKEVLSTLNGVSSFAVKKSARRLAEDKFGYSVDGVLQGPSYLQANLGYVLTAHKAQGSEFNSGVVVLEPSVRLTTTEGRRWAYTAVSRFKKSVQICWKDV